MKIEDHDIDLSFSEQETLKLQRLEKASQPEIPRHVSGASLSGISRTPRAPKKLQLERLTLSGTTSAVLRAIKKVDQYPPEYFVQEYSRQTLAVVADSKPTVPSLPEIGVGIGPEKRTTPKPGLLERINPKTIYTLIMTDPLYKNSIFNMSSTFILGGLGFVFWIIIARLYKPEMVGVATTLISIMTLLNGFTVMGLNSSLNRYLPKSAHKNALINSSFLIVLINTLVVCGIFFLGLPVFSPQLVFIRSNLFYVISFCIFIIFCSWNSLVESAFMAFRSASNILIKNIIISVLKLILPFAFIVFGAYGIFMSTAFAITLGVLTGLLMLLLNFKMKPSLSIQFSLIKEILVYSFANYTAIFMFYMPSLVLPVIILNVLSARYAAYYYIASMIQSVLQIIPMAASQALLTEGSYNEAEMRRHVKKAAMTILTILGPATIVVVLWGNTLLQFFGKSYASEAFQFLQLYSASTIFTALILVANSILNVRHKIASLVISNVVGSLLTLWLSYAFIAYKLVGVGWGWMLGQVIAGLISVAFVAYDYLRAGKRSGVVMKTP
jgi:O-antigen/teichoic acid export membrane protein